MRNLIVKWICELEVVKDRTDIVEKVIYKVDLEND